MGHNTGGVNSKGKKHEPKREDKEDEHEQDQDQDQDDDVEEEHEHSSCKPTAPSANQKEKSEVELELKLLEAFEIYPPTKLQGMHKHFVLYGLTEFLRKSFNRPFTSDEVLKLLDRFYNLEMLKPDDEEMEFLNQQEEFSLPKSYFEDEDSK